MIVFWNKEKDADIIQYLDGKKYNVEIKRLLREEMRKQEGEHQMFNDLPNSARTAFQNEEKGRQLAQKANNEKERKQYAQDETNRLLSEQVEKLEALLRQREQELADTREEYNRKAKVDKRSKIVSWVLSGVSIAIALTSLILSLVL